MDIVARLVEFFINKKKVIAWASAIAMLIGGAAASMSTADFKDAVCSAPVLDIPKAPAPAAPEVKK
jgi:hypothetical protein